MLARPNHLKVARLGLIVAKRINRRAVTRNHIRRLIRESFREHQALLAGLDIVVLVRCVLPRGENEVFFGCLKRQWRELVESQPRH